MMNFINSIPESIGWAMVGFEIALCVVMIGVLISYGVQYIKDCKADEEEA